MVLPVFAVPIAVGLGSSLITGIATYFMMRPTSSEPGSKVDSRGEIYNNVHLAVKENNIQNSMLVLLVALLVFIKFFEITVFAISKFRRSLKRKYQLRFQARSIEGPPPGRPTQGPLQGQSQATV